MRLHLGPVVTLQVKLWDSLEHFTPVHDTGITSFSSSLNKHQQTERIGRHWLLWQNCGKTCFIMFHWNYSALSDPSLHFIWKKEVWWSMYWQKAVASDWYLVWHRVWRTRLLVFSLECGSEMYFACSIFVQKHVLAIYSSTFCKMNMCPCILTCPSCIKTVGLTWILPFHRGIYSDWTNLSDIYSQTMPFHSVIYSDIACAVFFWDVL